MAARSSFSPTTLERAAQTRTKIQLGGLLVAIGANHAVGIPIGSDIEKDFPREASLLAGIVIAGFRALAKAPDVAAAKGRLVELGIAAQRKEISCLL